ncbi:MAG TPA: pseudouridine synthase [Promineifilum sp.]|nr:pseudouridine synthase [Promineifilum sp.]HRO89601.1 pseudouridine synthase [Promineifilum sp.]HRQ13635.1 pseudouridine synthase [Promineifilum sp.]
MQKIMARANIGSRRSCELIISEGRVTVGGRVARLGDKADPDHDRIAVDGRLLFADRNEEGAQTGLIYIALNKPRGVISSLEDELEVGRTTVRDLIEIEGEHHIYPVGRLDKPSEGLVLMTNDGALAHRLTHPRYGHEKVYDVTVEGDISEELLDQWRHGVVLDGRITAPAPIEVVERTQQATRLRITLREGRKRQIRRIAAALGHPVQRLIRERIGPLALGDLPPGQWRYLTEREISKLKRSAFDPSTAAGSTPQNKPLRYAKHSNRKRETRAA